jgi:N-acetylmuramoyl-L-alanine amidase
MNSLTVTDLDFVARTVMAEAEGESYKGKVAVAAVIYNRARHPSWWGKTIIDACLTNYQFSAWNSSSPRRNKIGEWSLGDAMFRLCMQAAIEGFDHDPTDGADHYFAHDVVTPSWADGLPALEIGNHTFVKRLAL